MPPYVIRHDVLLLDSPLKIPCKSVWKHWKSVWSGNHSTNFCVSRVLSDYQDSSAVASLLVEYESNLLPHLPFPLHSSDQCLVFALQPRSKSYRAFYSKVRHEATDLWQRYTWVIWVWFSFSHSVGLSFWNMKTHLVLPVFPRALEVQSAH